MPTLIFSCDNALDLDVSNDPVHGNQEQGCFNGYYDQVCYAPLFIFCGRHLLGAKLRPSNVDPAEGALEELQRIIAQIRRQWKTVVIVVRGTVPMGERTSWVGVSPRRRWNTCWPMPATSGYKRW